MITGIPGKAEYRDKCFSIHRDRICDLRKDDMKSSKGRRLEEFVGKTKIKELHPNPQPKTVRGGISEIKRALEGIRR